MTTFTTKQLEALARVVLPKLTHDIVNKPAYWAQPIVDDWEPETLVEYLGNRDPATAVEIIEALGFDPCGDDAPVAGWPEEDPDWSLADWRYEVANGDTRLGYADWVEQNKEADAHDKE